jgi:hypothetical protein
MIYKFRLQFEDYDDVYRDIEIKSVQTFEALHNAIQKAIKFDGTQMASFFMSNDNWRKGTEIVLMDLSEDGKGTKAEMHSSVLADFIDDPHQKILYEMDNIAPNTSSWVIGLELIKISADDPKVTYPVCVKTVGEPPKQYKITAIPAVGLEEDELIPALVKSKPVIFEAEEHFVANENAEDEEGLGFGFGEEEDPENVTEENEEKDDTAEEEYEEEK